MIIVECMNILFNSGEFLFSEFQMNCRFLSVHPELYVFLLLLLTKGDKCSSLGDNIIFAFLSFDYKNLCILNPEIFSITTELKYISKSCIFGKKNVRDPDFRNQSCKGLWDSFYDCFYRCIYMLCAWTLLFLHNTYIL